MKTSQNTLRALGAITLIAALTACGGGGGSPAPAPIVVDPVPAPAPIVVVAPAGNVQTWVGAPTYAANSLAASAFSALNTARLGAGAGVLAQSAQTDVAASAHAAYLTTNLLIVGITHNEDPGKPDFYAATLSDRVAKAGYSASFSMEVMGGTSGGPGSGCALGLLNTVYHGVGLLTHAAAVGIGFGSDGLGIPMCVINPVAPSSLPYGQVPAAGSYIAYPYSGQTNVMETFYAGYELPRPPIALFPNLTAGTPIIVGVRNAEFVNNEANGKLAVTVTGFALKDAAGNLVPSAILSNTAITAGAGVTLNPDTQLLPGFVVLVPLSPLAKGTAYTASFGATLSSGGQPVSKSWSFTTNP